MGRTPRAPRACTRAREVTVLPGWKWSYESLSVLHARSPGMPSEVHVDAGGPVLRGRLAEEVRRREVGGTGEVDFRIEPGVVRPRLQIAPRWSRSCRRYRDP